MLYHTIEGKSAYELDKYVNEELRKGWRLHGSVVVAAWADENGESKFLYLQTMIKDDD